MSRHRVVPLYKEQDKELSIIVRLRLAPNDGERAPEVIVMTSSIVNNPQDGPNSQDRRATTIAKRIAIVEEHVRLENAHDLEGVLATFGDTARYDDEPWDEHYDGRNGVRRFYEQLMKALPDLEIEVQHRHVSEHAIILEVMIRGTHLGGWRGLPATGRRVEFPLCGVYTFDGNDSNTRLAGEKIYYDRGTVLRQLGVFHEPPSVLGQIGILVTHPVTIARALGRKLQGR
jgi:steroid delta-isomerase-like uncharacterized protein